MSNPVMNRTVDQLESGIEYGRAGVEVPHLTTERLTVAGTMNRTLALFGVLLLSAAVTWFGGLIGLALPAAFVALGLGMWASFSSKVRPAVIIAYAVCEGVFLAGISMMFELAYPGIVGSAVLASATTAALMFVAYQRRWIKVTQRFTAFMSFALLGYLGFALVNLAVSFFGNSGGVYSTQFGWLAALVGVGLASFTLVLDFADIERAAGVGAPVEFEWRFAFGLLVSLVWMYTEILRLLAILRSND